MTDIKPGDTVDVVIKGVQFAYGHNNEHNPGRLSIRADDGRRYTMPPQAAITPTGDPTQTDAATLRERISNALNAIDRMTDEQTLDPWTAHWLRKQLDPNPRHWPPQAGDVWDDGRPFGFIAPLWFAQVIHETKRSHLVMVPMESGTGTSDRKTPEELLAEPNELRLVYRHKDGGQ